MKVLNLQCAAGHSFEGWFGSEADFEAQHGDGRVECPLCGNAQVQRMPSAPRLNISGARGPAEVAPAPPPGRVDVTATGTANGFVRKFNEAIAELLRNTEDVGERFPEEARRIHYGEAPAKGIRGQASPQEREALREEGIEVMSLPLPVRPKRTLQ